MEFMKKIIDHPTGIIEEGGAALPLQSFVLHVGEELPEALTSKFVDRVANSPIWDDIIPRAARAISSDILK